MSLNNTPTYRTHTSRARDLRPEQLPEQVPHKSRPAAQADGRARAAKYLKRCSQIRLKGYFRALCMHQKLGFAQTWLFRATVGRISSKLGQVGSLWAKCGRIRSKCCAQNGTQVRQTPMTNACNMPRKHSWRQCSSMCSTLLWLAPGGLCGGLQLGMSL